MKIRDSVVWISGAGSGIGKALAHRFAEEGAQAICLVDLDLDAAQTVADEVGGLALRADVRDQDAVRHALKEAESQLGAIDLLCLNAGVAIGGGPSASDDDWLLSWEVNVMSHIFALREMLPKMMENGGGYILHTASAAGLLTNIGAAPYSVTKHAVVSLAEWVAITYGDHGIGVSCLCPQFVSTALLDEFKSLPGGENLTARSVISPEAVADAVVDGLDEEEFLILPHPEVLDYYRNKASDYDGWIKGMRRLQERVLTGNPPPL